MKKSLHCALAVLSLMMVAAPALAEETVESAEKQLIAAWDKLESVTGKMNMVTNMERMGQASTMEVQGDFQLLMKDGKNLSRLDMKGSTAMGTGEGATKMEFSVLQINDGEFSYMLQESMGQKAAIKTKIDEADQLGGKAMFEKLHQDYDLKLMPEEKVNDTPVFVFELTPKTPDPQAPAAKEHWYFCQKSGITVKKVTETVDGKPFMTVTMSEIKLGETIDPKNFVFEAPEGVTVMDQTNM